jgi:hypothetical protein
VPDPVPIPAIRVPTEHMQKVVVPAVVAMPDNACLLLVSVVQIPYSFKKKR